MLKLLRFFTAICDWLKSHSKASAIVTFILGILCSGFFQSAGGWLWLKTYELFDKHGMASIQIYAYTNEPNDLTIANNIYQTLKVDTTSDLKIRWEGDPIFSKLRPAYNIDTIFCTPSSARYVKGIVEKLSKIDVLQINKVVALSNQADNKIIFGHLDIEDKTPISNDELDNAQALCTKKP